MLTLHQLTCLGWHSLQLYHWRVPLQSSEANAQS